VEKRGAESPTAISFEEQDRARLDIGGSNLHLEQGFSADLTNDAREVATQDALARHRKARDRECQDGAHERADYS
jgi:hypothetical protein